MIVHLKRKAPKTHWYLIQAHRISCKPVLILKYCVTPFGFSSATDFQKKTKKQHSFLHAHKQSQTHIKPIHRQAKSTQTLTFSVLGSNLPLRTHLLSWSLPLLLNYVFSPPTFSEAHYDETVN